MILENSFVIVTLCVFVVSGAWTAWMVQKMYRADWSSRETMMPIMRRMLMAMGFFQVSIGMLLIAQGATGISIAVIGMGLILIVLAWRNVLTRLH